MSHIAVERNRRRQMNEHLKVLRSLTPCFYIKRGDQASIIGGVIEFIKELQQVLQSLEANKRRKSLSPSPSPRPLQLINTPPPPPPDSPFSFESITANKELGVCCNSSAADVEAKISGSNVLLKVIARKIPGQILKIISVLEKLSFQIIHLNISSMEDMVLYSFIVKIGFECRLSLEELALEVQRSFSLDPSCNAEVVYKEFQECQNHHGRESFCFCQRKSLVGLNASLRLPNPNDKQKSTGGAGTGIGITQR